MIDGGTILISRGPAERADLTIEAAPETLEELAFGALTVRAAQRAGKLRFDGDRTTLDELLAVFSTAA